MVKLNKALIGGSFTLLITYNLYNLLNFSFQFGMARILSVIDYGILATLISITYISGIFSESIQTLLAKYSSSEGNYGKVKNVIRRSFNKSIRISSYAFIFFLIISIFISPILKINYYLIVMAGIAFLFSFVVPINRGVMQGKGKFKSLGWNLIAESTVKLILGISLVLIGWGVFGAMVGILIGFAVSFLLSFYSIKSILSSDEKKANIINLRIDTKPVFIVTSCILLFYSLDLIIAKMVFSSEIAGYYAIASVLSKTVFWGTQPISRAMFSLTSRKQGKREERKIFSSSIFILSSLILIALVSTFFLSDIIVRLFAGRFLNQSASILLYLIIGTSLLSYTNLLLLYKISLNKLKNVLIFPIFLIMEIFLLFAFSDNLTQFSIAFLASSALFFLGSAILSKK